MALTIQEVEVTPEIAMEWLEGMDTNRRLIYSNLENIVLAMREDRWHDDGTPIRFNEADKMIDGQHRMTAIVTTGQTRRFFVIRGVKSEAMTTLDTGRSRSRADVLSIHDPELRDVTAIAGGSTICLRWEKGARGNSLRNAYVSNDEFVVFFDQHKDLLIRSVKTGGRVGRALRGVTQQSMTLCAYLFAGIDEEDAQYFWDRLIDGVGLEKGSPILALRRFFDREAKSSRDNVRVDIAAALTIKAWNAYRQGRDVEILAFKVGGAKPERFPEPV